MLVESCHARGTDVKHVFVVRSRMRRDRSAAQETGKRRGGLGARQVCADQGGHTSGGLDRATAGPGSIGRNCCTE